jgi:hypothetical protein
LRQPTGYSQKARKPAKRTPRTSKFQRYDGIGDFQVLLELCRRTVAASGRQRSNIPIKSVSKKKKSPRLGSPSKPQIIPRRCSIMLHSLKKIILGMRT